MTSLKKYFFTMLFLSSFVSLNCMEPVQQPLEIPEIEGHIFQYLVRISSEELQKQGECQAVETAITTVRNFLQTCKAWHVFYCDKQFNGSLVQRLAHPEFFPAQARLSFSSQALAQTTGVERGALRECFVNQNTVYPLTYVTFLLNTQGACQWTRDYLKAHPVAMECATQELIRVVSSYMQNTQIATSTYGKIALDKDFAYILCLLKLGVSPCVAGKNVTRSALELAYMYIYPTSMPEHFNQVQKIKNLLLNYAKLTWNIPNAQGYTYLMHILKRTSSYKLAIDLIKNGADTTWKAPNGETALSIIQVIQLDRQNDENSDDEDKIQEVIELLKENSKAL
jgi:hypothetical protein